ncbi:MAG: hypothetical protein KA338_01115 [Chloroflexi bacterium]|nr:hypothetical protein [Chloroflexota bacterium]
MPHQRKPKSSDLSPQIVLPLAFEKVLESAEVLSREAVSANVFQEDTYNPISQTANYMQRVVQAEKVWETTLKQACEQLLAVDARQLYYDFFKDLSKQIEQNPQKASRIANLLHSVAIRGFGMTKRQINIRNPPRGGTRWHVILDEDAIRAHLENCIVGENFLNILEAGAITWANGTPLIGGSDVSQHRSAVPVPSRFFKRSVPFVLNNAAGTLFSLKKDGQPKYENLFNPKPEEELLRWMLIDPSYQDELEPEDYQRILASAMDIGQYKFDLNYLLKTDKRTPDIIFRDGSLFPQDAYLDNFILDSKRGEFVREAIREMLDCLGYSRELGVVYCGIAKTTVLKVYSAVVDWYIAKYIDLNWEVGNYTLNDGQAMSILLASPTFVASNLEQVVSTCLIRRSFTTRAALNEKVPDSNYESYFQRYEAQTDIDIKSYRRLCDMAHLYMFFIGHSKSPQQQLPRYEFFHSDSLGTPSIVAQKILSALQSCSLVSDKDHSFMADEPLTYLLPAVTQQAHNLSKDVGKHIDRATGQWIMAQYHNLVSKTA